MANTCERCGHESNISIMSWFTEEIICMGCSDKERAIKKELPNDLNYEGCGYIPDVAKEMK